MGIVRRLEHWLKDQGPFISVDNFVPDDHPLRQWANTFPWDKMVQAVESHFAKHTPQKKKSGRAPVSIRVLLALELLKAEFSCSDEQICSRLRTDFAVMYACGITRVQVHKRQRHFVLPEILARFRAGLDEALIDQLLSIQASSAMEDGLVSPEHVVVDTFVSEQGGQRVTDASTLYKAKKKSSR